MRLPCPEQADTGGGHLLDLLVACAADQALPARVVEDLAAALGRWTGNDVHQQLTETDGEGAVPGDAHLEATPWVVVAGDAGALARPGRQAAGQSGDRRAGRVCGW